jgi:hypothetical protein
VRANGPENFAGGMMPGGFTGNANEVYTPVPSGALTTSFSWDFYNAEGPMATFNDGMLVDVINAAGSQLAVLAFADTNSPLGTCIDTSPCGSVSPGVELGPMPGREIVTNAALPASAAFLRIAVWNGVDNLFPSHGVVDGVSFTSPQATYPGTGEDLLLRSGITLGPAPHALPSLSAIPDVKSAPSGSLVILESRSPAGSLNSALLVVGFNLLPTGAFPPPDPVFQLFNVHLRPGFGLISIGGFLFPAVLPGGTEFSFTVPPGLTGLSLLIQGAVLTPLAANGILVATNAHEIQFL